MNTPNDVPEAGDGADAPLLQPALYGRDAAGRVVLKGMRCACGRIAFPRQPFGCERCGRADALVPLELPARGLVAAALQVHLHTAAFPKAPFAIAAIRLDDGPMVQSQLDGAAPAPGVRVDGVLTRTLDEHGQPCTDLRFVASLSPSPEAP